MPKNDSRQEALVLEVDGHLVCESSDFTVNVNATGNSIVVDIEPTPTGVIRLAPLVRLFRTNKQLFTTLYGMLVNMTLDAQIRVSGKVILRYGRPPDERAGATLAKPGGFNVDVAALLRELVNQRLQQLKQRRQGVR
jgi:hypothetical protein